MGLDEVGAMGKDPCAVIAWVGGGAERIPVTTHMLIRFALMRPLLACTHPRVAPEFPHDLP